MKSIFRKYTVVTVSILSVMFLVSGIISVKEETSYVISGEKSEVVRVQSTTSQRLLLETKEENNIKVLSVNPKTVKSNTIVFVSFLPSPLSQIVWGIVNLWD